MMTFRVSHVEAFRRYQQEEDAKLEDLLANIRGERGVVWTHKEIEA